MSKTVTAIVAQWKMNYATHDIRDRESVIELVGMLKSKPTETLKALKEEAKSITSSNMKRDFNSIIRLCVGIARVEWTVNLTHLEVGTMKRLSALGSKIEKRDDLSDDLLDPIAAIVGTGASYNNSINIVINKINSDIEPIAPKVSYKEATAVVSGLSKEDREKLLNTLMVEFGYEVEEVA